MKQLLAICCLMLATLLVAEPATAEELNFERAQFNYQMFCQGCHTPDGSGARAVPQMKEHIGYFLQTPNGREYLVRVPGSATSALDNEQLAEVLNWIIIEFSGASSDDSFVRYTPEEVGRLRQAPLNEVVSYRARLLTEIANNRIEE